VLPVRCVGGGQHAAQQRRREGEAQAGVGQVGAQRQLVQLQVTPVGAPGEQPRGAGAGQRAAAAGGAAERRQCRQRRKRAARNGGDRLLAHARAAGRRRLPRDNLRERHGARPRSSPGRGNFW
jgi:hypothetical protein